MSKKARGEKIRPLFRRQEPALLIIMIILGVFDAITLIYCIRSSTAVNVLLSLTMLFVLFMPQAIERRFSIKFSTFFKAFLMSFITLGALLGAVYGFYQKIEIWDEIMHTACGFFTALVGFCSWDAVKGDGRGDLPLGYRIFVAISFAVAVAGIWELYEFTADQLIGTDMQRDTVINSISSYFVGTSPFIVNRVTDIRDVALDGISLGLDGYLDIGLIDTMIDILMNVLGAVIFCILACFSSKKPDGWFQRLFIPRLIGREKKETREETTAGKI